VNQVDLGDRAGRHVEHLGALVSGRDDQWQDVEPALAVGGPAERAGQGGELRAAWLTAHGPVRLRVAGVPDELLVPDAGAAAGRRIRCEHGDDGPDPAVVRGGLQMAGAFRRDVRRAGHLPAIPDLEALPVQPPDAAAAVTPRHPRAELQFLERVPVGTGQADLPADFPQPRPGRGRAGDLAAVQLDELGGQIHVHGPG
jgi:hypothetical protein